MNVKPLRIELQSLIENNSLLILVRFGRNKPDQIQLL